MIFGLFMALSTFIHLCYGQHGHTQYGRLRLTREYLLALNTPAALDPDFISSFDCPPDLTRDTTRPVRCVSEDGKVECDRDCAE